MDIFYREGMAPADRPGNYSKSPSKPRRFMEFLRGTPVGDHIKVCGDFGPVTRDQLLLAHESRYVGAFLTGGPSIASSSGLAWSPEFRDSVLLTNGSLLAAIKGAVDGPHPNLTMAPVSGFHHARPDSGGGFCTFSGQVIAAVELYRTRGLRGAWVDMDGHFGNSIEDSRGYVPDLNLAIPRGCNINPRGSHRSYLLDLEERMYDLKDRVIAGQIDYVCVAHGADSHEWDQLGSQCTTEEWLQASQIVYDMIARMRANRAVPVTLALFGGYRDDHPESVLGLHAMDVAQALFHLVGGVKEMGDYRAEVRRPTSH
jgi:acetoin utilization deacetylase AcuC-like enzyme